LEHAGGVVMVLNALCLAFLVANAVLAVLNAQAGDSFTAIAAAFVAGLLFSNMVNS
jgi:hypothetical protein